MGGSYLWYGNRILGSVEAPHSVGAGSRNTNCDPKPTVLQASPWSDWGTACTWKVNLQLSRSCGSADGIFDRCHSHLMYIRLRADTQTPLPQKLATRP